MENENQNEGQPQEDVQPEESLTPAGEESEGRGVEEPQVEESAE